MRSLVTILLSALLLVACASRGDFTYVDQLPPEQAAAARALGTSEAVFVGTSRAAVAGAGKGAFGFDRSARAAFIRYDITIPPDRDLGEVNWPKSARRADPSRDFLTLDAVPFADADDFRRELHGAMARRGQRDVVVYVHGFNNTMAESVYRVAQMHHDLKVPGVAVHYAWPSRGSALGYVYDRDSALFGRDGLEELLAEVAGAGADRILIVAHSMGGAVAMETLRQAAIRGDRRVMDHIGGVVLLSPDLDVDLFKAQADAMGSLPQPFIIFGSSRDSILNISSRISGAPDRLGNLKDLRPLGNLKVTYLDTAAYSEGSGHFNVGTSPALLQLLGGIASVDAAFRAEGAARVGLLPGVVLTVQNATAIVLAPVEAVAASTLPGRPCPAGQSLQGGRCAPAE